MSGARAAHGFIDDVLGHLSQFAVFGLADRPQLSERLLGAAPAACPDQADRLIDHRARQSAVCNWAVSANACVRIWALCTATAEGLANNSPSSAAWSSKTSLPWAYTLIAPIT